MIAQAQRFLASAVVAASITTLPGEAVEITATPPQFAATTRDPVLLRYRFTPGDAFDVTADISIVMDMQMGVQRVRVPTQMKMVSACTVEGLTVEGNARVNVVFTRAAVEVKGPQQTVRYDSQVDQSPATEELKHLAAMLNQNVPCTVTPRGEVSDVNLHFMREALQRAGAAALFASVEQTVNQSLQGAFIQLAESPVSAGAVYDAGEITQEAEGVGTMTGHVRYQILSVSAAKTEVILKPLVRFDLAIPPGSPVRIESTASDGWVLFDRARGNIDRSYGQVNMKMSVSQNNQTASMTMDMIMKYVTTYRPKRSAQTEITQ